MKNKTLFSLGYSSCPNDTFIFKAIARQVIDLKGLAFNIGIEDVETLNQNAAKKRYDITKLSVAALGSIIDKYALLRTGAALGKGCGPLVIGRPNRALDDIKRPVIAVPGLGTTAFHLFRFYLDDCFSGQEVEIHPMTFDKIMPAVLEKKADFGVIIHEGRFVYQDLKLSLLADLGEWWEESTGLPIPLGCIAIQRDIDPEIACTIQSLIGQSIDHAFLHPAAETDYIRTWAQELDQEVIQQHIDLYVNDFSKNLGDTGEKAILTFFDKAARAGLIKPFDTPLFAC